MPHRRPGGLPSPCDRRSLALRPRLATGVPWTVLHREATPLPDSEGTCGVLTAHMTHSYHSGPSAGVQVPGRTIRPADWPVGVLRDERRPERRVDLVGRGRL